MENSENIKNTVKQKYTQIAVKSQNCGCSCCGTDSGATIDYKIMSDEYSNVDGYFEDADLGLGCGLPTEHADIKPGNTVLDLGSGAGNDVFIARRIVGAEGKVIGVDFTAAMIKKAEANNAKLGYENVEFKKGDIESLPVEDNSVDVIISNCVLNLVPDKKKAFAEMYRVNKSGGHFCVSDIVLRGSLPESMKNAAAMYTGCVAGAVQYEEYLDIIKSAGFKDVNVPKEKKIVIPDEVLLDYVSEEELENFKNSGTEIVSITVKATK